MFEVNLEQLAQCTKFIISSPRINNFDWYFRCERGLLIVDFYLAEDDEYMMLSRAMPKAENLIITSLDQHKEQLQKLAQISYNMIQESGALD
ncbi:hypothetical protein [Piscirickettsia litoralis]|uniref:Uncharacterized protein n=1 Tax=Piscirickettsia litoralis TaxID=1891921 RepID=A0ABX3A176_9GAMM|nr:hypothetical protein [Piscirickettsia litoralis]ODN42612.1 hypothetical protein BGC07_06325 [Piscirickettsia litoralis]